MPEQPGPAEIAALEQSLAALTPLPSSLDRDRLMFRAGQATWSRRRWLWPAATAAMAAVAAGLGATMAFRPSVPAQVKVAERIVYIKAKEPAPASPAGRREAPEPTLPEPSPAERPGTVAFSMSRLQLQNQLLHWGLDGLPSLPPPPARKPPVSLQRLFGSAELPSEPR
jgi:hypothetical protein